jgi:galactokinase
MSGNSDNLGSTLRHLYGQSQIERQRERYKNLIQRYKQEFSPAEPQLFSAPGRTEISGNHTDHNNGRVLAASINLDSIAAAATNNDQVIVLYSEGYEKPFEVNLDDLQIIEEEKGSTSALIRGIASRFSQLGFHIGGFNACITSDVFQGSGLSSSASIEVLIGTVFNVLYNKNEINVEMIAKIGQYAENNYFGKPCGLMDQMACAVGGIIAIDFENTISPVVRKINFDPDSQEYTMLVVNTGGSHENLTDDYAAIPIEMKTIASEFEKNTCRDLKMNDLIFNIDDLRKKAGDRALLRAFHFINENERVLAQVESLEAGDFNKFLDLVKESGNSSFKWLQNIYSPKNVSEQGVSLALALTENYLDQLGSGACRIHGGGFAGTIQVFLPNDKVENYRKLIEPVFGKDSIMKLKIRRQGTVHLGYIYPR